MVTKGRLAVNVGGDVAVLQEALYVFRGRENGDVSGQRGAAGYQQTERKADVENVGTRDQKSEVLLTAGDKGREQDAMYVFEALERTELLAVQMERRQ